MRRPLLSVIPIMLIVLVAISAPGQTARKKRAVTKPAATTAATTEDVQQLKDLVSSPQQPNAAAQKAQSTTDQAQSTATQAQKDAAEAERLADQASENAVEAKTGLALIKTSAADSSKRLGTLEGMASRSRGNGA